MLHPSVRRLSALLGVAVIAGLAVAGCATRDLHYTMTKKNVSQAQLIQDQKLLQGTSGVHKVIARYDSSNTVTVDLYVTEGNSSKGLEAATDLGYQWVRN